MLSMPAQKAVELRNVRVHETSRLPRSRDFGKPGF